ncbi:hypothetical protein [Pararhodonellum marinum]|uniref:hypothetical protein n=1 Tax=Pararhodonellum marinum TaxID=2755358 RepID=UPI00188ED465|nr:hypothetical protein [Pararhodonellum marinum]
MKSTAIKIFTFACILGLSLGFSHLGMSQTAGDYFNRSAKQYVNNDRAGAGQLLAEGLQRYPNDPKLNALLEKLNEEEEQDQQDQQQEDQQQEQQDQEQQDQDSSESKDGEGDEQTDEDQASKSDEMEEKSGDPTQEELENPGDLESDLSDREKAMEELRQKLQEMNITPEQATQILDAMEDAERRFIQQNQKKPTKRQERGLPDW